MCTSEWRGPLLIYLKWLSLSFAPQIQLDSGRSRRTGRLRPRRADILYTTENWAEVKDCRDASR